jgi:peptidoglycan hydrolase FlgJ
MSDLLSNIAATERIKSNMAQSSVEVRSLRNLQDTGQDSQKALQEACSEFESIFIKMMLDSMRKTVPDSGLIKKSMGRDIYEDFLYDEYAQKMAKTANLGLAETMYNRFSNMTT